MHGNSRFESSIKKELAKLSLKNINFIEMALPEFLNQLVFKMTSDNVRPPFSMHLVVDF
jgi:hypothetical protein